MANISGRADTGLIQAATTAAAANIPKDLSDVHKRMAKAYAKSAKATGELWGEALEAVGKVGSKLVENAKKTDIEDTFKKTEFEKRPTAETGNYDEYV